MTPADLLDIVRPVKACHPGPSCPCQECLSIVWHSGAQAPITIASLGAQITDLGARAVALINAISSERDILRVEWHETSLSLYTMTAERDMLKTALTGLLEAWDWIHAGHPTAYDRINDKVRIAREALALKALELP